MIASSEENYILLHLHAAAVQQTQTEFHSVDGYLHDIRKYIKAEQRSCEPQQYRRQ